MQHFFVIECCQFLPDFGIRKKVLVIHTILNNKYPIPIDHSFKYLFEGLRQNNGTGKLPDGMIVCLSLPAGHIIFNKLPVISAVQMDQAPFVLQLQYL